MTPCIDISFCWAFGDANPVEKLSFLQDCGFEGIELWPDALNTHGPSAWADALRRTGMRAFQLCPYFNFMEGEPKLTHSRAELDAFLAAAREMDCKRIRVFTGPPWGAGVVGARVATAAQWSAAIAALIEYCDAAAGDGIELCLECHCGSLMEDSPNALRLIRSVGRANLTVNLQIPFVDESWQTSVALLGPYTTHIHMHNWTRSLGEGELTNLKDGAFDWLPVVSSLVAGHGRRVTLSVEHAGHSKGDDPHDTARADGPFLRALRERAMAGVGMQ